MATASTMATTTATTATAMVKKPGPPVPPRPQHAAVAASLLKNQRESVSRVVTHTQIQPHQQQQNIQTQTPTPSSTIATATATSSANTKVSVGSPTPEPTHPVIQKKPILAPQPGAVGRTVIYKSPSMNLQKRQEEREKRYSGTDFPSAAASASLATTSTAMKFATATASNVVPKPPLKLRKAPDVPCNKPRVVGKADPSLSREEHSSATASGAIERDVAGVEKSSSFMEKTSLRQASHNNIVIVQSSNGVSLNRHKSMSSPKPPIGLKDTRLSLGRADFEQVGKIQIDQLQPGQPLPKPRKIVKMPVATLDVDGDERSATSSSLHSSGVSLFRRSKTTLDSLAARANVATVATSTATNGFLSGKTVEIKNNLKNAAERLFSEIIVNQHRPPAEPATIITKHERAVQHQALLEQELAQERQRRLQQTGATAQAVTVVSTDVAPQPNAATSNCTRISINSTAAGNTMSPGKSAPMASALNSSEKKTAFHEILISELAAMRAKSSSMENLHTDKLNTGYIKSPTHSAIAVSASASASVAAEGTTTFKTSTPVMRKRCNSLEDQDHDSEDVDADNVEDAVGDEEDSNKKHKVSASNSPRKRCPSGCSSDSSPYGTERSSRIRTSDWIEVGDNGKQVTLTSCHISLEDSGLEDEERIDEMSSSGVGDSWDSVKEAENEKRSRSVKRVMSITDLPPLPKSLSGITKMLGSDSGLISDADASANGNATADALKNDTLESEKENISNNVNSSNNSSSSNNNNNINSNTSTSDNDSDKTKSTAETIPAGQNAINGHEVQTAATDTTPIAPTGSTLDTQLATLKKEMFGLRQLDLSLLSQLWALNDSIQEFRNMLQEQEQEMERESYSPTPSSYGDDSGSSGPEGEGEQDNGLPANVKPNDGMTPKIITTQPKPIKSGPTKLSSLMDQPAATGHPTAAVETSLHAAPQQRKPHPQYTKQRPPLPKSLDGKLVPRMRSAPPPPPTSRKAAAPPRPT